MRKFILSIFGLLGAATAFAQVDGVSFNVAKTSDFNLARGYELYMDGKYRDAQTELMKSIDKNPNSPYAYLTLARLYEDNEMPVEQMHYLDKAIELSEKSYPSVCVSALYNRFFANIFKSRFSVAKDDAERAYALCQKMSGRFAENKHLGAKAMAVYYMGIDNPAKAIDYFREAVTIAPFDPSLRYLLADALLDFGSENDIDEIKSEIESGLNLSPSDPSLLNAEAKLAIKQGDYALAADNVLTMLEKDGFLTRDDKVWATWDEILQNDPTPLIIKLKGKMADSPLISVWPELLGQAYEGLQPADYVRAAECYHKAYEIAGRPWNLLNEVYALHSAGNLTGALEMADKYIATDTTLARIYALRAEICADLDRKENVLADYAKAISLEPDKDFYYYQRAWFERYNGMLEEAALDMTTAIQKDEAETHYYMTRGQIFAALGEKDMAREDFEMARDIAKANLERYAKEAKAANVPSDSLLVSNEHQQLAMSLFFLGDTYGALHEMELGQETNAEYVNGALYNKACLLSLMNRKDDALKALGQAIDAGYEEYVHLGRDTDLDNIRSTSQFAALVAKAKENALGKNSTAHAKNADAIAESTIVEVPFTKEYGGTLNVPCTVNGLPLKFTFDSGAATVTMSLTEANFMLRNGYLKKEDLGDRASFGVADGALVAGTNIVLRSITFGGVTLKNVKASIVATQSAGLLLGQTAMSRYGQATIDYDKGVIRLEKK